MGNADAEMVLSNALLSPHTQSPQMSPKTTTFPRSQSALLLSDTRNQNFSEAAAMDCPPLAPTWQEGALWEAVSTLQAEKQDVEVQLQSSLSRVKELEAILKNAA